MALRIVFLIVLLLLPAGSGVAQNETATTEALAPTETVAVPRSELEQLRAVKARIDEAEKLLPEREAQRQAVLVFVGMTIVFLIISTIVLLNLASHVREIFWKVASSSGPDAWRTYLVQLPLGVPEGSVRALVSIFVIVFGLVVLVMQKRFGLDNVEAISGFVGIVITFYFTTRGGDQTQKALDAAREATDNANQLRTTVTDASNEARATLQTATTALEDAKRTVVAGPPQGSVQPPVAAKADQGMLSEIRDRLDSVRQVAAVAAGLGVGTEILAGADKILESTDRLLGSVTPLLSGNPDASVVATVLESARQALGPLENAGLPGTLADAIAGLKGTFEIAGPIVAGIPGGPIGIVGGIVMAGVKLAQNQRQFETLKAALLKKPFDPVLLPTVVDGNAATAALAISPHLKSLLGGRPAVVATALMREVVRRTPAGGPVLVTEIAARLIAQGLDAEGQIIPLAGDGLSVEELGLALEEYRSSLIFQAARDQLDGQVDLPAIGGVAAATVSFRSLVDVVQSASDIPHAASQIERLVFLAEALGKLPIGAGAVAALIGKALGTAQGLLPSRTEKTEKQE